MAVVPRLGPSFSLVRVRVPPCLRMMPWETQRPRPVPRSPLVVKKGWKRCSRTSGGMPGPLSMISMRAPGSGLRLHWVGWVGIGGARANADGDRAAGASGFGGVGDEVGEDLAELGGEAVDGDLGGRSAIDGDAEIVEAAVHEEEEVFEHLLEVDGDGRLGFAVEAEHGAADLGDARQLGLRGVKEVLGFLLAGAGLRR